MTSSLLVWWLYATGIALLLGVAALAAEASARSLGRPARWIWLVALAASVAVPAIVYVGMPAWLAPAALLPAAVLPATGLITLPALSVAPQAANVWFTPDSVLLVLWAGTSLVLGALLLVPLLRLRAARRRWRRAEVDGVTVWLTHDTGPAAWAGAILLPEWALSLDAQFRRLILVHEQQHVRARDPLLLLAGLLAVVFMPWNAGAWWQLRRLRLAIELDCDARVLHSVPDARLYGSLLIEIGRRRGGRNLALAFSEPSAFLERRIRALCCDPAPRSLRRAGLFATLAALPLVLAVCADAPTRKTDMEATPADRPAVTAAAAALEDGPRYTPMTDAPRLSNRADVQRAIESAYPPELRAAGVGGTPMVWFYIDETGRVARVLINRSSGHEELDEAALEVARQMQFEPATNRGEPVPVWVSLEIRFEAGEQRTR